jgi:hypothetical protein
MFHAIDFRSATAKSTAPIPSDLRAKQAERERIARDIRAFQRRGGRIERLTADATGETPNGYGYNNTTREKPSAPHGAAVPPDTGIVPTP